MALEVTYKRSMSSQDSVLVAGTTSGAVGGGDLAAAAGVIADRAKALAALWSRSVPGSISVSVSGNTATITASAPPAYPNEIKGVRHPVFGRESERWVTNQYRPFLAPALEESMDPAMARYARKIDRMCRSAGFN